jgi:hypothetical protein
VDQEPVSATTAALAAAGIVVPPLNIVDPSTRWPQYR